MKSFAQMDAQKLLQHVGSMRQIAGIRLATLDDGRSRGIRVADVSNGSGLAYTVLLDRGMDIGHATFKGIPLAFETAAGYGHPAYHEPEGFGWLRNWGAGLLTGCGLRHVGTPELERAAAVDGPRGLHGRLSNLPAEQCCVSEEWIDGHYRLTLSGRVREASLFAENLVLRRTLTTGLGDNRITIDDRVTNEGVRPSPLMILYHINFGFPILSEHSRLVAENHSLVPRNADAEPGLATWNRCQSPTAGYVEQCFYHDLPADTTGMARMRIENPDLGLGIEVAFRKRELPRFCQWKMLGLGEYAMGLEPGNCHPDGQEAERKNGTLVELQPGESVDFHVEIRVQELGK